MIPIENSIAGRVADIHSLLPASGLHIVGETFLPIHFQLLAVPGARIEDLKTVHSHVHALGQCRNIIRRHKLKPVVAERHGGLGARSRGMGATKAAPRSRPGSPARSMACRRWSPTSRTRTHNTTRFVVLSKDAALGAGRATGRS